MPAHPRRSQQTFGDAVRSTADDLARVLDIILVDRYDEDYTAFLTVLDEEMGLPMAASLLGTPVTATELDYHVRHVGWSPARRPARLR